ncbi:MAG: hypothetical protein AAB089_05230 [Nitrospirota bacterium]
MRDPNVEILIFRQYPNLNPSIPQTFKEQAILKGWNCLVYAFYLLFPLAPAPSGAGLVGNLSFLLIIPMHRDEQVGMTGSYFLVYDNPQQAAGRFIGVFVF